MKRNVGILMPVSSLPSPYGIGTMGRAAYRFIDYLKGCKCGIWQVLPLQPTSYGDSPYSSFCAYALNHYLIDLDLLVENGLLTKEECAAPDWGSDERRVDYGRLYSGRVAILRKAFARFDRADKPWRDFLEEGKYREYALFMSLKERFGGASSEEWGVYREYGEEAEAFAREHEEDVLFWQFTQFLFLRQWNGLKAYAHARNVKIIGDIPFYVARDSVEMWKHKRELFLLDGNGSPESQAGVPPDAFSSTGQLWGNPVYDWEKMKKDGYKWWHNRIEEGLSLYDTLRIDHFIGFVRYYAIPMAETDARVGQWRKGPGAELFKGFEGRSIVAEDLGVVTDEVRAAVKETGYPGMKILQHAFDGWRDNEHRPSNYTENIVAYTGTHDNETLKTRIDNMNGYEYDRMLSVLKEECGEAGVTVRCNSREAVCKTILRLLYACRANTIVFPLQDALLTGEESRLNMPSVVSSKNWSYRFLESDFTAALQRRLARLAERSGRI